MKTDPNLCPPPAPDSGDGRRPSDRPSPVTALGGVAASGATTPPPPGVSGDRKPHLRAIRSPVNAVPEASGEFAARRDDRVPDDATPEVSGEFDPYRFGSHMLPYDFLQDALQEPLRAPRDEDLLHETLPPLVPEVATAPPVALDPHKTLAKGLRLSPEAIEFLRGGEQQKARASARRGRRRWQAAALLVIAGALSLAFGLWVGKRERTLAQAERAAAARHARESNVAPVDHRPEPPLVVEPAPAVLAPSVLAPAVLAPAPAPLEEPANALAAEEPAASTIAMPSAPSRAPAPSSVKRTTEQATPTKVASPAPAAQREPAQASAPPEPPPAASPSASDSAPPAASRRRDFQLRD